MESLSERKSATISTQENLNKKIVYQLIKYFRTLDDAEMHESKRQNLLCAIESLTKIFEIDTSAVEDFLSLDYFNTSMEIVFDAGVQSLNARHYQAGVDACNSNPKYAKFYQTIASRRYFDDCAEGTLQYFERHGKVMEKFKHLDKMLSDRELLLSNSRLAALSSKVSSLSLPSPPETPKKSFGESFFQSSLTFASPKTSEHPAVKAVTTISGIQCNVGNSFIEAKESGPEHLELSENIVQAKEHRELPLLAPNFSESDRSISSPISPVPTNSDIPPTAQEVASKSGGDSSIERIPCFVGTHVDESELRNQLVECHENDDAQASVPSESSVLVESIENRIKESNDGSKNSKKKKKAKGGKK